MLVRYAIKCATIASVMFGCAVVLGQASETKPEKQVGLLFNLGVTIYRDSGEFYQGEPIFVQVALRRTESNDLDAQEALQIGTEKLPWHHNVRVCLYKLEDVPTVTALPASSSAATPTSRPKEDSNTVENGAPQDTTKRKILLKEVLVNLVGRQSTKHKLKVNEIARSLWAIDPNLTSKLSPGMYVIQGTFDTTKRRKSHPDIFHGKYQSNEVTVVINQPKTDQAKAEVLSAQATYFGFREKYADEIQLLKQALKLNPARRDIHCQLGRAYELRGEVDKAIKEYRAYVEWVRSLGLPRTGKDGLNDHADIIEAQIKIMEQLRNKKK